MSGFIFNRGRLVNVNKLNVKDSNNLFNINMYAYIIQQNIVTDMTLSLHVHVYIPEIGQCELSR